MSRRIVSRKIVVALMASVACSVMNARQPASIHSTPSLFAPTHPSKQEHGRSGVVRALSDRALRIEGYLERDEGGNS
jgi:hypothetical protein